jgi:DNA-binding XRE family transcriptional regulator
VWAGPSAWIHSSPGASDSPALLFANLSRISEAVTPELSMRWLATCRSRLLWVVAFVEGRPNSDDTVRIEGILRSLDGRLSLLSEPRFTPLRRRWEGGEAQVRAVLDLLRPDSILEVRTLPDPLRYLLRFGDGRAATLSPEQLGVGSAGAELQFATASPGPGGRSLRIGSRRGPGGKGLVLEAEVVQELLTTEEDTADLLTPEPVNVSMPIGPRIRLARRDQGLSQAELGERIGMAQAAVSNLERGVHSPRMDTLRRVAQGLGLSVPALLAFQVEE